MSNEITINYRGFHPTKFTYDYIESIMRKIHEQAPNGARLYATFHREDGGLRAKVSVYSKVKPFFAMAEGHKLIDVVERLESQLHKQLDRWKSRRFRKVDLRDDSRFTA